MKILLSIFSLAVSAKYFRHMTVGMVDTKKYMGKWYVISHIPTLFEQRCHGAIEAYSLKDNGEIDIDFYYRFNSFKGKKIEIPQVGKVYDEGTNAHWKVQINWPIRIPISFDYLIVLLDENYQWSVVSVPNKNYLWVLSRTPTLSKDTYQSIVDQLEDNGYAIEKIVKVKQK